VKRFAYTCEGCLSVFPLTATEFEQVADPNGRFLCDDCDGRRMRKRAPRHSAARDDGCIVTVQHPDGNRTVHHQSGPTFEALRQITDGLEPGCVVLSISTPRTILRDLDSRPRVLRGGRANKRKVSPTLDPLGAERTLLAKIGRLDLHPQRQTTAPPA
jgi:hypothetical protein